MKVIHEHTMFHVDIFARMVKDDLITLNKRGLISRGCYGIIFGYRGISSGSGMDFLIDRDLLKVTGWYPNGNNMYSLRSYSDKYSMIITIMEKRGHETGRRRFRIVVRRERKGDKPRHLRFAYLSSTRIATARGNSVLFALRDLKGITLWRRGFALMPDIIDHDPANIVEWHIDRFYQHLQGYRGEVLAKASKSVVPMIKAMRRAWTLAEANRAVCKFLRDFSSRKGFTLITEGGKTTWTKRSKR